MNCQHQSQSLSDDSTPSALEAPECQKPLSKPVWWALFLLATYTMSLWFQTFKAFTRLPNLTHGLAWLGVIVVLILLLMVLAYDSYVQEKAKGRVQKRARLFEWLMGRRFLLPPSSCPAAVTPPPGQSAETVLKRQAAEQHSQQKDGTP